MPQADGVLSGIVVVERGRRLATAAVGFLLASLGASVVRLESEDDARQLDAAPPGERMLRASGKQRVLLGNDPAATWQHCATMADALLLDPPAADAPDQAIVQAHIDSDATDRVVCVISPSGRDGGTEWLDAPEPLLQALGGALSVTGVEDGQPQFVQVPIVELSAAILGASAMLAALRARGRDGAGQLIDLSLIETASDQLRLHLPMLGRGSTQPFRQGCRHPMCCPWNAYHARDGWVMVCSTSDAQWLSLLEAIGRADLKTDPRFATAHQRRTHVDDVDGLVQGWADGLDVHEMVAAVDAAGVPAGAIRTIPQVLDSAALRTRGTVVDVPGASSVFGTALGLGRTPAQRGRPVTAPSVALPVRSRPQIRGQRRSAGLPLAGISVVEITRYTAGPLAGLVLASLGADVIKVESPGGEETRGWPPQYDGASGYFINHNFAKRSVTLDLRRADDQRRLVGMVGESDVLLQNLRPGVMDKIGLGAREATARHPRLIHTTISGYGLDGPELPALDTVIQGAGGLPSLVGDGEPPIRVGFSIADQISGHLAALGVLAAVTGRDHSGLGQIVDIAMSDAIAWLTQLSWPDGHHAIGASSIWRATDGWVAAAADDATVRAAIADPDRARTRDAWQAALAACGILAAPVLEPEEVFVQPVLTARRSVFEMLSGARPAPVLAMPLGLTKTPVLRPTRLRTLGEDNDAVLHRTRLEPSTT